MRMMQSLIKQAGGQIRLIGAAAGAVVEISIPVAAKPEF
jgi:hypothetical protein